MIEIEKIQMIVREAAKLFSNRVAAEQIKEKGTFDYVTSVDEAVQMNIQKKLYELYPEIQFMGEAEKNFRIFEEIFKDCQDIRRGGSASIDLVNVACGRIDGYMENHLKIWDYAAGALIVWEAGGEVLNYEGQKFPMEMEGNIVAGTTSIARIIVEKYIK